MNRFSKLESASVNPTIDAILAKMFSARWIEEYFYNPKTGYRLLWSEQGFEKATELHPHIGFRQPKNEIHQCLNSCLQQLNLSNEENVVVTLISIMESCFKTKGISGLGPAN